eukprot:3883148-Pleurochrysis_carterae.AAC.2
MQKVEGSCCQGAQFGCDQAAIKTNNGGYAERALATTLQCMAFFTSFHPCSRGGGMVEQLQFENNTIVIGMVTKGNTELTLARWRPTFETYLTSEIEKYGCRTRLVPLQFDTYETATRNKTIDLIFPNPTAFQV